MTRVAWMVAAFVSLPALAWAGKFGGFSSDGQKYLDGDARVCTPLAASETGAAVGAPACERVADKKELAAYAFRKPKAGRRTPDGKYRLDAPFADKTLTLVAGRDGSPDVPLASWEASDPIASVTDLYVSTDGALVAVDYVARSLRGDLPQTVVFDVRRPLAAAEKPAVEPPAKPPAGGKPAGDGEAFERALKHGGVWEQPLIACDQARVTLKLKKDRKFSIRIETRCQGDKWVTNLDGKWVSEGDVNVALTFENDDGTVEAMPCVLGSDGEAEAKEKEDTLTCQQEDVTFAMKPARR